MLLTTTTITRREEAEKSSAQLRRKWSLFVLNFFGRKLILMACKSILSYFILISLHIYIFWVVVCKIVSIEYELSLNRFTWTIDQILILDSNRKIPLTCCISSMGCMTGCAPVSKDKQNNAPVEMPHRMSG